MNLHYILLVASSYVDKSADEADDDDFHSARGDFRESREFDLLYEDNEDLAIQDDGWNGVRFETSVFVDIFSFKISQYSKSLRRYACLAEISSNEIDFATLVHVEPHGGLHLNVSLSIQSFSFLDGMQNHEIIFPSFDFDENETSTKTRIYGNETEDSKQFVLSLKYGSDDNKKNMSLKLNNERNKREAIVFPEPMSVRFNINRMVILYTAWIAFQERIHTKLSFRRADNADNTPLEGRMAGNAQTNHEESGSSKFGDGTSDGGVVLPVSLLEVSCTVRNLEIHLLDRKVLGLVTTKSGTRRLRYPPKSIVLCLSQFFHYKAIPTRHNLSHNLNSKPYSDSLEEQIEELPCIGLPSREEVMAEIEVQILLKRTALRRHMFEDLPDDFFSGDNEIVKPFTIALTMINYRHPSDSGNTPYQNHYTTPRLVRKNCAKDGNGQLNALYDTEEFKRFVERNENLYAPTHEGKDEALDTVTTILRISLERLEARIDTGDYKFLLKVMDKLYGAEETATTTTSTSFTISKNKALVNFSSSKEIGGDDYLRISLASIDIKEISSGENNVNDNFIIEESVRPIPLQVDPDIATSAKSSLGPGEKKEKDKSKDVGFPSWIAVTYGILPIIVFVDSEYAFRGSRIFFSSPSKDDINKNIIDITNNAFMVERASKFLSKIASNATTIGSKTKPMMYFDLDCRYLLFGIGNNLEGFSSPFLRFTVERFVIHSAMYDYENIRAKADLKIQAVIYNHIAAAWECMIEPWSIRCDVKMGTKLSGYTETGEKKVHTIIHAFAPYRLNFNFTDSLVENLSKLSYYLDEKYIPIDDERLHGTYCPNWIVNESGKYYIILCSWLI